MKDLHYSIKATRLLLLSVRTRYGLLTREHPRIKLTE